MEHNAGEIVELAVRRQNVNISELSKRLNVHRRTLYNWFRQKKLHSDVILEIGKAINYDFSNDFEGELNQLNYNQDLKSFKKDFQAEHPDSVYYWMEKYIALLEDYKRLVRKNSTHNMLS
jgi:AcrR family transcriptional regulator